jgi:hypothetical protein
MVTGSIETCQLSLAFAPALYEMWCLQCRTVFTALLYVAPTGLPALAVFSERPGVGNGSIHPNDGDISKQSVLDSDLVAQVEVTFHELLDAMYEAPQRAIARMAALKAAARVVRVADCSFPTEGASESPTSRVRCSFSPATESLGHVLGHSIAQIDATPGWPYGSVNRVTPVSGRQSPVRATA